MAVTSSYAVTSEATIPMSRVELPTVGKARSSHLVWLSSAPLSNRLIAPCAGGLWPPGLVIENGTSGGVERRRPYSRRSFTWTAVKRPGVRTAVKVKR